MPALRITIVAAALAVSLAYSQNSQASSYPVLTRIAEQAVGQPVTLSCLSVAEEKTDPIVTALGWTLGYNDLPVSRMWGYTLPLQHRVVLSQIVCAGLLTLWSHPRMDEGFTIMGVQGYNRGIEGMAVHALTHELGHIKFGYLATTALSERAAECYAQANDGRVASLFGVSPEWAGWMHRMGEAYHTLLPAIYQDGGC